MATERVDDHATGGVVEQERAHGLTGGRAHRAGPGHLPQAGQHVGRGLRGGEPERRAEAEQMGECGPAERALARRDPAHHLVPQQRGAGSLGAALKREPRAPDWEEDLRTGLDIIASRSEGLARFMTAYARLARLPQPTLAPVSLAPLIARVAALEAQLAVQVVAGPDVTVMCDAAQIEQALINLVKNAAEAALEQRSTGRTSAGVRLAWTKRAGAVEISIEDDGPGVANPGNLFVPFFTTKPAGSGIGLHPCR